MNIIDHQICFIVKVLGFLIVLLIATKYRKEQVAIALTSFKVTMRIDITPLSIICVLVCRLRNQPSINLSIDKDSIR
ncbi:hypothetical protein [cyanobacterium endosymbiont of Rhopalodia gibberula]|uniref:hypothetical protein n=1 Tax=cyanobacterium endosymbiont of Rhopalodia gibberula TaxID=1763363 RepID=UPI001559A62A|nr:hypothetical protein [cyanobacterium endosymbiont of Rhopalodia gibberula]